MRRLLLTLFAISVLTPVLVYAQMTVPQGGTGTTTFPGGYVVTGSSALRLTAVPTTTVSCSGSTSCSSFNVLGSSPITISSTGATFGTSSLSALYPIIYTTSPSLAQFSLAFGTTTSNIWAGTQTFTNSPIFSTLGAGTVNSTVGGTIYNTATSTPTVTSPITYSGTLGQFIGGVSGTFGCATCLVSGDRDWRVTGSPAYLTPTSTIQSIGVFGSSTIGNGIQTGGLTINGGATTTGNAYFASNVGIGTSSPLTSLVTAGLNPIWTYYNTLTNQMWQVKGGAGSVTPFTIFDATHNATELYVGASSVANPEDGEVRIGTSTNLGGNSSKLFVYGGSSGANIDVMGPPGVKDQALIAFEPNNDVSSTNVQLGLFNNNLGLTQLGFKDYLRGSLEFTNTSAGIIQVTGTTSPIVFGINASEIARFTPTGFGIASTSPSQALSVNGNFYVTGANTTNGMNYSLIGLPMVNITGVSPNITNQDIFVVATSSSNPTIRAAVFSAYYTGAGTATGINGLNAFATAQSTATGNLTAATNGGGLRNGYSVSNKMSGYGVTMMSGITSAIDVSGTLASSTDAADYQAQSPNITSGNAVTNMYGLWVRGGAVSGTLTNRYGLYVDDLVGGTNRYGMYQAGSSDLNYFAGKVGIGTTSPYKPLSVQGGAVIAGGPGAVPFGLLIGSIQAWTGSATTNTQDNLSIGTSSSAPVRGILTECQLTTGNAAASVCQPLNGFGNFSGNTDLTTTRATGGGLRNRYGVYNSSSGHNINTMSALSAFTTTGGALASTTNTVTYNAELTVISANNVVTNNYGFLATGGAVGGTLTNNYGVYIEDLIGGTNRFGVYQAGATDTNVFLGKLGLGTTTPQSQLTVLGDIGTDGLPPTVSLCGTSPALTTGSTDTAGEVTEGTIATGCTITFAAAKTRAPFCTTSSESGLAFSFAVSNTALTITNIGALSATKVAWICVQNDR